MLRGTTRDTTSTTRYYEAVRVTANGTRYYEELRVVLADTKRYYELFYKSQWDITRGFRYIEWFFRGILPKIIFQKTRYKHFAKFMENQLW